MPTFFLHTPEGREGPYTDVDLLDLLDRGLVEPDMLCQDEEDGEIMPVSDLFLVIHPDEIPGYASPASLAPGETEEDAEEEAEAEPEAPPQPQGPAIPPPNFGSRPDEQVFFQANPSLFCFWPPLLFVFFCCLVSGWWYTRARSIGPSLFLLAVAVITWAVIMFLRNRHCFVVTNKRVEVITGLIIRSSREVRVQDIRAINVKRSGASGFLGVGTVEFSSAGGADGEVHFKNIRGCQRVKKLVRNLQ